MLQLVHGVCDGEERYLRLPDPDTEVQPGVPWGSFEYVFTPAFWAAHAWQCSLVGQLSKHHRLGTTLCEEVAACLLGGYGIPAEVGLAAYQRLRMLNLLNNRTTAHALQAVLAEPLTINGRSQRYRFARQKASYLAATLTALEDPSSFDGLTDVELRDWLTGLPGVGLKTASWITRNFRDSDAVAIIDIHVFRAGRLAGIFPASATIQRNYQDLEKDFIAFANALAVRTSQLDALIWDFMRRVGSLAVSALRELEGGLTNPVFVPRSESRRSRSHST
jgi:thermostable 8-oxoguanine DNA glycosylase